MGCARLLVVFVAFSAVVFSAMSVGSCRFFEFQTSDGVQQAGGLFTISYRHDFCILYEDLPPNALARLDGTEFQMDASFKASRGFGVLSVFFGFCLAMALLPIRWWCSPTAKAVNPHRNWMYLAGVFLFAGICQAFTFLIYIQIAKETHCLDSNVDADCGVGWGGILSIVAAILYLLIGAFMLTPLFPPPGPDDYSYPLVVRWTEKLIACTGIRSKQSGCATICRGLVQHWIQIVLLVLAFCTLLLSTTVVVDCRFYEAHHEERAWHVGLFGYYYPPTDSCIAYEKGSITAFRPASRAAQVFGILAAVFGGILCLLVYSMIFLFNYPARYYKLLPFLAVLTALCQPLTLLMYVDANDTLCQVQNQSCGFGDDALMAVINTGLYLLMAPVLMYSHLGADDTNGDTGVDNEDNNNGVVKVVSDLDSVDIAAADAADADKQVEQETERVSVAAGEGSDEIVEITAEQPKDV